MAQDIHANSQAQAEVLALFVSDLHLQESLPQTAQAFLDFLQRHAVQARQLFLLGDLFEYWAGDDDLETDFHRRIVQALRAVSLAGTKLYWIAGNRDFLIGPQFAEAIGAELLAEPFVTTIAGQKIVLVHGDAQCTDDLAYMTFRAQVRQPVWQQTFLAQSLAQRKAIIAGMRDGSRAAQKMKTAEIMDVNQDAINAVFEATGASLMVHGHTHRPARHVMHSGGQERVRFVLPDWDCELGDHHGTEAAVLRGGWCALHADGSMARLDARGRLLENYPAVPA